MKLKADYAFVAPAVMACVMAVTVFSFGDNSMPTLFGTPVTVPPKTSGSFQNFEKNNGTPAGIDYAWPVWFATVSFTPAPVHGGGAALKIASRAKAEGQPDKDHGGTVGINPATGLPVNLSQAKSIYVWVYDTQVPPGKPGNTVQLKIRDYLHPDSDKFPPALWSKMSSVGSTWTKISWSLDDPALKEVDLSRVKNLEIYEWNDGLYYLDDIGWE